MNSNLVESIVQVILSLSPEERMLLEAKLFHESEPKTSELMQITQNGGSFDFLSEEPDIYTLEDGEPI